MPDLFERKCTVCQTIFLTDGGEVVCSDKVCQTVFERAMEMQEMSIEVETLLDDAMQDKEAEELGLKC